MANVDPQNVLALLNGDAGMVELAQRAGMQFIEFLERRDDETRDLYRRGQSRMQLFFVVGFAFFLIKYFWDSYMTPGVLGPLKQIQGELHEVNQRLGTFQQMHTGQTVYQGYH